MALADIDQEINLTEGLTVIQASLQYITECERSKVDRLRLNRQNRSAIDGSQDYSYKLEGQSKENLPKTATSVEHFAAFIGKALTQFGNWFSVQGPKNSPLSDESIRALLSCFLERLPEAMSTVNFTQKITDASKIALLESVMIFKVHGGKQAKKMFKFDDGDIKEVELDPWQLRIDLIRFEDYGEDPSGRGLYKYQRVEKDFHVVKRQTEEGIYDKAVVTQIEGDFQIPESTERHDEDDRSVPSFRRRIVLHEFWGTLLNQDGTVSKERVTWTIANSKYLIKKPTPFPFWHGEDPFIKIPLIRKPFTIWHTALYDSVVPLNFALNDLFNLMLDGGLASVWGIKQIHLDWLENPEEVTGGIPQGKTLAVTEDMPDGAKVIEQVSEGEIPTDALQLFNIVDRELNNASLQNEIQRGLLPPSQTSATAVVESSQNQAALLDSITSDMERELEKLLKKAFLIVLQNMDDLNAAELQEHLTTKELFGLARMTPAERFGTLANGCLFKVFGLSATLTKGRDFQRLMAVLQTAQQNPLLLPVMMRRVSPDKLWSRMMKMININPSDIEKTEEDLENVPGDQATAENLLGSQGGSPTAPTGEAGVQSEIAQTQQPTDGL